MGQSWKQSDTAPLIRLVLSAVLISACIVAAHSVVAVRKILVRRAAETTHVTGSLAEAAAARTVPRVELLPVNIAPGDVDRALRAPAGFVVELVYAVPREQGSWVCLATDMHGRLVASAQAGGLYQITLGASPSATLVEAIDTPVGAAQGLLCVANDLYCVVAADVADGPGLYRLTDRDSNGYYDEWKRLRELGTGGEHGPHGIVLGSDGMLYIVAGNHTPLPEPERSVVPRLWDEDLLLPRLWDARGHAVGILAPGGWICRTDRDGTSWELFAIGFRNCYDIAFNTDGELFTYDADMEWDMGAPWYRPTRINHVVGGAEFGWRSGSGKWPAHRPDGLPAVVDIGPGSPTGVCFGTGARFPSRYRRALFALDWTFGTIYAVHMTPAGASYNATFEPFVTGRPLPVADVVVNPADGALYFVVGGRGVESALYRVRYVGDDDTAPTLAVTPVPPARALRRRVEKLHFTGAPIDEIWPHLGHTDRFVAFAARVALEHQPADRWIDRVFTEPDPRTRFQALIAVARIGDGSTQSRVVAALEQTRWTALDRDERILWLRALALGFIRLGPPDAETARRVATLLGTHYPTGDESLDRELCDLLVYLDSPAVVRKTIPLMERAETPAAELDSELLSRNDTYGGAILKMAAAMPQRQQIHYAMALSHARAGWTPALRERYFEWFASARRTQGGLSFAGFLDGIRDNALEHVPEGRREWYFELAAGTSPLPVDAPSPVGPGRSWTVDEVVTLAAETLHDRDFDHGRRTYDAALCGACHRFAGTGIAGGPDLTQVATRYTVRELVESMVEPSRTISDQYEQTRFELADDTIVIGRVVGRDDDGVDVMPSMLRPGETIRIDGAEITREAPSSVSAMMPGLLNRLNADEVIDLMAYLLAEGDERDPVFSDRARREK